MNEEHPLARTALLVGADIFPALTDEAIIASLVGTRVRIRADITTLSSYSGQTAVSTAAIVIAQLGCELVVDMPRAEIVRPQPPLVGDELGGAIKALTHELITPEQQGNHVDVEVLIGAATSTGDADSVVRITGGDWDYRFDCGIGAVGPWTSGGPIAAVFAAIAAGAEVFRFMMRNLAERHAISPLAEHPITTSRPFSVRLEPLDLRSLDLGTVDLISCGALTTAAMFLLLRIPELAGSLRVVDSDIASVTNLNRYLLMLQRHIGMAKAKVLSSYATERLAINPVTERYQPESAAELEPLSPLVLVGVDDIPSRWVVQEHAPDWLGIAATSHFETLVSEHTARSPCAACLHPHDDEGALSEIPTVSFVSAFAGAALAYRALRAARHGGTPGATVAYPFNLAAPAGRLDFPLAARNDCRVRCAASRALAA